MMSNRLTKWAGAALSVAITIGSVWAGTNFSAFLSTRSAATQPCGPSDWVPVYQGGTTAHIACSLLVDTTSSQTVSGKTISGANNTLTVLAASQLSGSVPLANGGMGAIIPVAGGIPCFPTAGTVSSSSGPAANLPVIWGGPGACPAAGALTGNQATYVSSTGGATSGGGVWDANKNWVPSANAAYLNVANTWPAYQTFTGGGQATPRVVSGTSDTLVASDCGKWVYYSSTTQVTVTLPNNLTPVCAVNLEQGNTGRVVTVCGTTGCGRDASSTSPQSPHGYTGTYNQPTARITVFVDVNSGGSAAHWVLDGNGA